MLPRKLICYCTRGPTCGLLMKGLARQRAALSAAWLRSQAARMHVHCSRSSGRARAMLDTESGSPYLCGCVMCKDAATLASVCASDERPAAGMSGHDIGSSL